MTAQFNRLLLTGAAGGLGRSLRAPLKALTQMLRLSDLAAIAGAQDGEEIVQCDLADGAAVQALLEGVDAVVHMGGVSVDGPWEPILAANIIGLRHLYEAARRHDVKRVVFASSNHAIGFNPRTRRIDANDPTRPDSNYGVSKVFGEALSRLYWDRYGIETVCLRIGSSFPAPRDRRMLITCSRMRTWLNWCAAPCVRPRSNTPSSLAPRPIATAGGTSMRQPIWAGPPWTVRSVFAQPSKPCRRATRMIPRRCFRVAPM